MLISSLEVAAFRGIPTRLRISLQPERSQQPQSLILFGDNGTGKSSIVDAIEFGLQSRVGRSKSVGDTSSASLLSFSANTEAKVRVEFLDGSHVERTISQLGDEVCLSSYAPHPLFAVSPFVLRRSDVLQFHETPENQRQMIFFDFFRTPKEGWGESPKEELNRLIKERSEQKVLKQELRGRLAELLHWSEDAVPQEKEQIIEFVRSHFYRGMSQREWKQAIARRMVPALPSATEQLINELIQTTGRLASLNGKIKRYRNFNLGAISRPIIKQVLDQISGEVTRTFCCLSNANFVNKVMITHSELTDISLSVRLLLSNSVACDPRQVLSEANLDLLAFLLLLYRTEIETQAI